MRTGARRPKGGGEGPPARRSAAGETLITYTYDFGDDWVHEIRVTDVRQGEPGIGYPR